MTGSSGGDLLPLSLGFADGILNALTLASASLLGSGAHATAELAGRIGVAALVSRLRWAIALAAGGIAVTAVGAWLKIA